MPQNAGRRDVVVIGGGLAGAATACRLAAAGRQVVALERDAKPRHKVCGEFVSVEAQRELAALGVDLGSLGAARIARLRLIAGARCAEAPLPFVAASLSRARLDAAILARAAAAGADIRFGVAARRLDLDGDGASVATDQGDVRATHAVLAVGKHDLRGWRRAAAVRGPIGLKMHFRLKAAQRERVRETVELLLYRGGYAGLEPIEDGYANLSLIVDPERFAEAGRDWRILLNQLRDGSPDWAERLEGAEARWPRPLAVAGVPYGYLAPKGDGAFRVGDQLAVTPSFTGDGMAIALHSARLAAEELLAPEPNAARHLARARAAVRSQMRWATLIARTLGGPAPVQQALVALVQISPWLASAAATATRLR